MEVTRELIEDVAAELGINDPSLVEKDYHVIQALSLLKDYRSQYFNIVFAGGTCLSKLFNNLQRMSEDVDLKLVLTADGRALKGNALKTELSQLKVALSTLFEGAGFEFEKPMARNSNHFIEFQLKYREIFDVADALRPFIKIQLIVCESVHGESEQPISSLINQLMNQPAEITAISCVGVVHTAAEKLVSLLRRTAAVMRGVKQWDDEALSRHIYDLYKIHQDGLLDKTFVDRVAEAVVADGRQYANQHPEFLSDAAGEMKRALHALNTESLHRERYHAFLGPLVYAKEKPTYDEGLAVVMALANKALGPTLRRYSAGYPKGGWDYYSIKVAGGLYQGVASRVNTNMTTLRVYGAISEDEHVAVWETKALIKRWS